jgi:hypothetical protein
MWKQEQLKNCIRSLYCNDDDIEFKNITDWFGEDCPWSHDSNRAASHFTSKIIDVILQLKESDEIDYTFINYYQECPYVPYNEEDSNCSNKTYNYKEGTSLICQIK